MIRVNLYGLLLPALSRQCKLDIRVNLYRLLEMTRTKLSTQAGYSGESLIELFVINPNDVIVRTPSVIVIQTMINVFYMYVVN